MQSYKNIKYLVDKLNKIHNNKYDYSLSICRNNKSIIVIKCPLHGMFEQRIDHHLNGCGCQTCSKNKKLTTDVYIQRAKEVHGKVYDYSKVVYTKSHDYVTIGCYKHGWFRQVACDHINNKMGCKDCYLDNNKLTSEEFIKKAIDKHGYLYSYDSVVYVNNKTKVTVTCQKHGDFPITPSKHLLGQGCKLCNTSKGESTIKQLLNDNNIKYVYQKTFVNCKNVRLLKFDFYLPDYNLCVEFDGKQHYESNEYFGGEDGLREQRSRDDIKTEYCKNNNIKLLRIKYDDNVYECIKHLWLKYDI